MSSVTASKSTTGTLGAASGVVVGQNQGRREITVVNDHASNIIYLQLTTTPNTAPTAVVGEGIRLNAAGGSWTSNQWDGAVAGIATGAGTNYTLVEF